ncbi:TPA: hypothetical protein QDB16_005143 [Burkholderia vietnamiensis]|nr:hypothetical protein [Burkholderia vietnamiensis]
MDLLNATAAQVAIAWPAELGLASYLNHHCCRRINLRLESDLLVHHIDSWHGGSLLVRSSQSSEVLPPSPRAVRRVRQPRSSDYPPPAEVIVNASVSLPRSLSDAVIAAQINGCRLA